MNRFPTSLISALNPRFLLGFILALSIFQLPVFADKVLVGQRSANGQFSFFSADEILINGSRKVKFVSQSDRTLDPGSLKSLPKLELSRAGLLRGDSKGSLFLISEGERKRVLPENFSVKETVDLSGLQIPIEITVVKDRKSKDSVDVPAPLFYVYIAGEVEPEQAAKAFVLRADHFSNLDEQLSAMQGFVRSFPNSLAVAELRASLERQLQTAIHDYDGGGAYKALLDAKKVSELAAKAFPNDSALTGSAGQIDRQIQRTLAEYGHLQNLAAIEDWTDFLTAYQDFEAHADSFPDMESLHRRALEEQTHWECRNGRALLLRKNENEAAQRFAAALAEDPANPDVQKQLTSARMLAAQSEAHKNPTPAKRLTKDSPDDRLFRQALYNADRAIQDHDYVKAQKEIQQAERKNADAPEILLMKASLFASGDQIAEALPLLERYDSIVTESGEREKGDAVRNQVLYELRKRRETSQREVQELWKQGRYSQLYIASTGALKADDANPDLLHAAGVSASVLGKTAEADTLLRSYLKRSDNLAANPSTRSNVRQLLTALKHPVIPDANGTPNWFSGKKWPESVYYCPASLAFQIPIESVAGFKFRMNYLWDHGRLTAIRTDFEDDKGHQDYLAMVSRARSNASDTGNFAFSYDAKRPQVRAVYPAEPHKIIPDFDGTVRLSKSDDGSVRLLDIKGNAQIVLRNDSAIDTEVVRYLMGTVTTLVSGNSFFNPFIWDGVHYFTATYDAEGRVTTAKEWNMDNVLHFSWDKQRLVEITAFHSKESEPYYQRVISYSGPNISGEQYSSGGRNGHIKYQYTKDVLTSAKVEDGGVHDGKAWVARLRSQREF